jgi:hypothetical protein
VRRLVGMRGVSNEIQVGRRPALAAAGVTRVVDDISATL